MKLSLIALFVSLSVSFGANANIGLELVPEESAEREAEREEVQLADYRPYPHPHPHPFWPHLSLWWSWTPPAPALSNVCRSFDGYAFCHIPQFLPLGAPCHCVSFDGYSGFNGAISPY